MNPVHHIELWTNELARVAEPFHWLLTSLGWAAATDSDWPVGRVWTHACGVYIVLEQSPDVTAAHDRLRGGLNHLALRCDGRRTLDRLRQHCSAHGWSELFADRYPHAGGTGHTALFLVNAEGFEFEIVAE